MTIRVSVIMASYNQGQYVAEALASLHAQTVGDWEAIVVDDGSTDNSIAVVEQFREDGRIRLLKITHAGAAAARNAGLVAARGEFIAFLDADDRWHPEKLARQLELFRTKPTTSVCYTRRNLIDVDGMEQGIDDTRTFHRGLVVNALFRDNFICFSSAMVRKRVCDQCGMFDERLNLGVDYEWWLRLSRQCIFEYVDLPLVDYRIGHASLSRRVEERLHTALVVMTRFRQHFDHPRRLSIRAQRIAFAETYRHLALVSRRESPWSAISYLARALIVHPYSWTTWRTFVGTLVPAPLRRLCRAWAGRTDWEKFEPCLLPTQSVRTGEARRKAG